MIAGMTGASQNKGVSTYDHAGYNANNPLVQIVGADYLETEDATIVFRYYDRTNTLGASNSTFLASLLPVTDYMVWVIGGAGAALGSCRVGSSYPTFPKESLFLRTMVLRLAKNRGAANVWIDGVSYGAVSITNSISGAQNTALPHVFGGAYDAASGFLVAAGAVGIADIAISKRIWTDAEVIDACTYLKCGPTRQHITLVTGESNCTLTVTYSDVVAAAGAWGTFPNSSVLQGNYNATDQTWRALGSRPNPALFSPDDFGGVATFYANMIGPAKCTRILNAGVGGTAIAAWEPTSNGGGFGFIYDDMQVEIAKLNSPVTIDRIVLIEGETDAQGGNPYGTYLGRLIPWWRILLQNASLTVLNPQLSTDDQYSIIPLANINTFNSSLATYHAGDANFISVANPNTNANGGLGAADIHYTSKGQFQLAQNLAAATP
jgi:hypothetical protein